MKALLKKSAKVGLLFLGVALTFEMALADTIYQSDFQVFTYETLCKGFYIVTDDGIEKIAQGFGDLAEEYTYTLPSEKVDLLNVISTTTDEKTDIDGLLNVEPIDTTTSTSGELY